MYIVSSFFPAQENFDVGHGYRYSWSVATPDAPRDGSSRMDAHPGQASSVGAVRNFNPRDDGRWGRPSPPLSEAPRSARRRWGEVSRPWVHGTGSSRLAHVGS